MEGIKAGNCLLVRYGEIHLKGMNRPFFLNALVGHIKRAVGTYNGKVELMDSRIFVRGVEETRIEEAVQAVCRVFGVHSVSPAVCLEKDFERICQAALAQMEGKHGTFKVKARRSDKRYPMDSMVIAREVGGYIGSHRPDLKVDVHRPDHMVEVEIRENAYVHSQVFRAAGGMPVGTNGRACLLLSGGIDSPVAGYRIAKRGVSLLAVHYHSFPYTSERAKQKVIDLRDKLTAYCGPIPLHVVPFTEIQQEIYQKCPDGLLTVLMRRYMMRIAQAVAQANGAKALVTGESIGQVASQTMEALCGTDQVVDMPVFRPLIGFDKIEIMEEAQRIDTYETSILPYEDCCTVFTPRHPTTKPKLLALAEAEEKLDSARLIQAALEGIEIL